MALTAEILKKEQTLEGLTDEQIKAIETLSTNDEQVVIGNKVGEIHGQYDRDVKEILGLDKPAGVKTYDWLKNDILPKAKGDEKLQQKLTAAEQKVADLEEKIKSGKGTEALTKKLEEAEGLVTQLRDKMTKDAEEWESKMQTSNKELSNRVVRGELQRGLIGKKFKDEKLMPKEVREMVLANAEAEILSTYGYEWVKDSAGKETLVFLDKDGKVLRNPNNKLEPYTADELYLEKVAPVLDLGKTQTGTGHSGGGEGGGDPEIDIDVSNARNQLEADEMIRRALMKKGHARGTGKFEELYDKMKKEINFDKLPFR